MKSLRDAIGSSPGELPAEPRTLKGPPGTFGLYARAIAPAIPGASLLPFVGGRGSEVPDLELRLDEHRVEPEHLAAYSKLCGFRLSGTLPATYPNVLAFPLHMSIITDRRFPFGAIGLVHVANRIEQHRPIGAGEPLDLRVTTTPLQPHAKGRTFSLRTEASVAGEVVWEGESTMLRRGRAAGERPGKASGENGSGAAPETRDEPAAGAVTWRLPADLGRRYAAISGDINPIHLYDITAKAFGFKRAIIHGLWTKARALAALEGRLPHAYAVDVRFRKPILLPATVAFGSEARGDDIHFTVQGVPEPATWPAQAGPRSDSRTGTPHLAGSIIPTGRSAR